MSLKYLIALLLTITGVVCVVLLIVFLASAAIFGSLFLPLICLGILFLFFWGITALNKN